MATYNKKPDFITSVEGIRTAEELRLMVLDSTYITASSFSADSVRYADNLIPFIDKHMAYLRNNPSINLEHYLSNLKLMTRIRQ